jgi:hypothetical protein
MLLFNKARKRLERQKGRYALVDGIRFELPVDSRNSPALMAAFSIDPEKAKALLPGDELHPFRLWNKGLLLITVIDYRETDIGKYIEFSIGIACTHGEKPAPRLLPALFRKYFGTGQYVYDLPVSTEISVKGGKGIWGMPKHEGNLNFVIADTTVSSQYDLDGQLAMKIEIRKPKRSWLPVSTDGVNYCQFRGLLAKSYIYFRTKVGFSVLRKGAASLLIGDHPRLQPLKSLEISEQPLFTAYMPSVTGLLDDHFENWFISYDRPPVEQPEGLESVVGLGQGQDWPAPPEPTAPLLEVKPVGLSFQETMAGSFSLGETSPEAGAKKGEADNTRLVLHASVEIDDLGRFIADPDHLGSLTGTVDFVPLGVGIPCNRGVFNLFRPAGEPSTKFMIYELAFEHAGKSHYLAGKKIVRDDPGFDLWQDTTTLYITLHEGSDIQGPIVGAGILTLDAADLLRLLRTMRALNAESTAQTIEAVYGFGRFFLGELWDSYAGKAFGS